MIYFDDLQCYQSKLSLSMAEAIAGMLTVAGVHEHIYEPRDMYLDDGEVSGVFSRSGNTITSTSEGSVWIMKAGGSLVVDVDMSGSVELFMGNGDIAEPANVLGMRVSSGSLEIFDGDGVVSRWPVSSSSGLRAVFSEIKTYKLEIDYKIVAVYIGDLLLTAHAIQRESDTSSRHLGILTLSSGGSIEIYASDLGSPMRYASVDPGEPVAAGLSRLVKGLPITMFARYSGAVKFYAPKPRESVADLSGYIDYAKTVAIQKNWRALAGVVRAVSALPEAEYIDRSIVDLVGAQIVVASNPNITTFQGTLSEAERVQDTTEEAFKTLNVTGFACPVLEPGDIITAVSETWIHDSSDLSIGTRGAFSGRFIAREYISEA